MLNKSAIAVANRFSDVVLDSEPDDDDDEDDDDVVMIRI